MTLTRRLVLSTAAILVPVGQAAAEDAAIARLIPADCMVAYTAKALGRPDAAAPSGEKRLELATIISLLNAGGLIPDEGQVYVDIVGRLPLLGRYEHALCLLDISSKAVSTTERDGRSRKSLRLEQLQAAAIFRTGGDNRELLEHVNHLVGRYTNSDVAKLTTHSAGDRKYRRLTDRRTDAWAVCEWGELGEFFVVTFGAGAYERIAASWGGKAPCLADDAWYRSAVAATHGDRAVVQCYIGTGRLEQRLKSVAGERYDRVVEALGVDRLTRDLWTIGWRGRAMSWFRCYQRNGRNTTRRYSDPEAETPALRAAVPTEARHYAIVDAPTRWFVDDLPQGWLAGQSPSQVQKLRAAWKQLEENTGIDIGGNLLNHLGRHVVIFDYPPHPLGIPFAVTIAIEIDDRRAVQSAVDALLAAWGRYLDQRAERKGTTLVRLHVEREPDGVWYLQAGILGPALKVTDRFVVISWSPRALREALTQMESAPAGGGP